MRFKAVYNDGTSFGWDEDDPPQQAYSKIDRAKLTAFELYVGDRLIHRLHLEQGQRLIVRRRPEFYRHSGELKNLVYIVGYQETVAGINRQAITAIFMDGHTELIGSWKNAPLDAVKLMEQELGH